MVKYYEHELLLDFDGSEQDYLGLFPCWRSVFSIIKFLRLKGVKVRQTMKGFHTYLTVYSPEPLAALDVNFLQLLFNSDFKREAFNYFRIKSGITLQWNVLFKRKWKYDEEGNEILLSAEKPRPDLEEKLLTTLTTKNKNII